MRLRHVLDRAAEEGVWVGLTLFDSSEKACARVPEALWQQTPDGRPGWAYYLLSQGYVLYMLDYPARGRSAC